MKSEDMPGYKRVMATNCWRGYIASWVIEDSNLYLYRIDGYKSSVDLGQMFGSRYEGGRVLADWFSGDIFVQYGERVFHEDMVGSMYANEKRISIDKGRVVSIEDYPTLTAEGRSDFIRIWTGGEISLRGVVPALAKMVKDNFVWSGDMEGWRSVTLIFTVGDGLSNRVLTKAEYERYKLEQGLKWSEQEYELSDDGNQREALAQLIEYRKSRILALDRQIYAEYDEYGVFLAELKRILNTAKVETLLLCGKPYGFIFEHTYHFDTSGKTVKVTER